ncbi:MAG: molybdopterin-dependent oxidoreductase [Candidatus Hodarchaeales archaeon]
MIHRLPPGQKLAKKMVVFSVENIPKFDGENWDITVKCEVLNPVTFSWTKFNSLPKVRITVNFHCVTSWSLFDTQWEGVLFKTIIDLVKPKESVKHVLIRAASPYSTNIPLEDLLRDDVILATNYNDKPLEPQHGGPVRFVIPHKYAYKSCKWVNEIEFLDEEVLGYWEQRGYSNFADPWKEQRYSSDDK